MRETRKTIMRSMVALGLSRPLFLTFSEISKGAAPDFEVHVLEHVTVNANGTSLLRLGPVVVSSRAPGV